MSINLITLLYLVASICFIQSLKGLSHPSTSIRGNVFGIIGMIIAILNTFALIFSLNTSSLQAITFNNFAWIFLGLLVGGSIGLVMARRVEMTKMPELVAFMHSMIGLAAVLIAIAIAIEPWAFQLTVAHGIIPYGTRIELSLGALIGAITFTGSVIAFGKLSGKYKFRLFQGKPVQFTGQHIINALIGISAIIFIVNFYCSQEILYFYSIIAIGFLLGVLLIIPIGGADMPVVVSMLNSYSGWAAAGIGFSLNNSMLIVAGTLVGSSGAILSYIMCKAMNRSFFNVMLGGFIADSVNLEKNGMEQRSVKSASSDDAAFMLSNAESVVIVPGYGLAVARAQHAVKELAQKLIDKGITVKYAIHPVAGRMPGHMNVLLAEAEIPYDQVFEMDEINNEFAQTDVAIVLGANDVVNPAALQKGSAIYGMPILQAFNARSIIVNKRTMATGYAGLDNELFYMDKTMMLFGDAKKVLEEMVKAI